MKPRLGALLSSDDYGSSVERTAKLHPLWQCRTDGRDVDEWRHDLGIAVGFESSHGLQQLIAGEATWRENRTNVVELQAST